MDALDDPLRRQRTIQTARALSASNPRPPAKRVYRQLMTTSAPDGHAKPAARVEIVRDREGAPLFRVRQLRTSIALVLPESEAVGGCHVGNTRRDVQRPRARVTAGLHGSRTCETCGAQIPRRAGDLDNWIEPSYNWVREQAASNSEGMV